MLKQIIDCISNSSRRMCTWESITLNRFRTESVCWAPHINLTNISRLFFFRGSTIPVLYACNGKTPCFKGRQIKPKTQKFFVMTCVSLSYNWNTQLYDVIVFAMVFLFLCTVWWHDLVCLRQRWKGSSRQSVLQIFQKSEILMLWSLAVFL